MLRERFDARVYKIGLRLDFTCPNRDGTVAVGGCIYCNNASHTAARLPAAHFGYDAARKRRAGDSTTPQGGAIYRLFSKLYEHLRFGGQARKALPRSVGLSRRRRTGDRNSAGLLADETLDLLGDLAKQTYLWLEIGLESMHDRTLAWVNRGHGLREFIDAVERAKNASYGFVPI